MKKDEATRRGGDGEMKRRVKNEEFKVQGEEF